MKLARTGWLIKRALGSSLNQARCLNSFPTDLSGKSLKPEKAAETSRPSTPIDREAPKNNKAQGIRNSRGTQSFVQSHNLVDGNDDDDEVPLEKQRVKADASSAQPPRTPVQRKINLDRAFSGIDKSKYTDKQLKYVLDQAQARATDNSRMIPFQGWLWPESNGHHQKPREFRGRSSQASKFKVDENTTFNTKFWDAVLKSVNPTRELREIARASLQVGPDGEFVHPHLDWLEQMIRIKYCDPFSDKAEDEQIDFLLRSKVLINHVFQVVKQSPCRLRVRWAALLHDIGKPRTVSVDPSEEKLQFRDHEYVGALMVDEILAGYGYPPDFRKEVATLVARSGRIRQVEKINANAARRLYSALGPLFDDFLDLYLADCTTLSVKRQVEHIDRAHVMLSNVRKIVQEDRVAALKWPLNGYDVMQITGIQPGMHLGSILADARDDYLARGPYSHAEAAAVVQRLYKKVSTKSIQMLRQEKKEARLKKIDCDPALEDLHKIKSPSFQVYASDSFSQDRPVYVFRLRLLEVEGGSEGAARMVEVPSYLNRELFRDIAVHESAGIYEFALIITHAFDFDFDDDFTFYRRKNLKGCPGASAATLCIEEKKGKLESYQIAASRRDDLKDFAIDPSKLEDEFDMLIHVSGQQAKDLNKHLKVINYRRIPGCLMSEEELEDLKWSSANEPPQEEVQTDDVTLDTQQVNLAYPLRTPHKGPASLATTLICHLFDRTRSCIVLELRQGGPWYIRVDLLEIRRRKEYEIAIPRTIASLGQAPDQYEES